MGNGEDPCSELEIDMLEDQLALDYAEGLWEDALRDFREAKLEWEIAYARCLRYKDELCLATLSVYEVDLDPLMANLNSASKFVNDVRDLAEKSMDVYIQCMCKHPKAGP